MKSRLLAALTTLAFFTTSTPVHAVNAVTIDQAAEFARCAAPDLVVNKLATDLGFIEGPIWDPASRSLIFSDIPNNELKRWTVAAGLTSFRQPSRNANGNTFDLIGRLLTCEHSGRRVARLEKDGSLATVVDHFEGKKFNSPNDVVVQSNGVIWFTDPEYGLKNKPGSKEKADKQQAGNFVFRHDPKTGTTTAVVRDFAQPNGLAFSPDEKTLYVADSGPPRHIRSFAVAADGTLSPGRVFCTIDRGGPDGIRVDRDGRVWSSAGDGVHIFSPDGTRVGKILVPESPANLCFGGDDGKTLFITARKSLYAVTVKVTGASR